MTCKKCKLNISAMLDGCLDQDICRQVEAHMISCSECKKYYDTLLAMRDELGGAANRPLPEGFEARLHFALEREAKQPRKRLFIKHMPIIAAAAASVLLIAGAISFSNGIGMKSAKNVADSAPRAQEFSMASDAEETEASDKYAGNGEPEAPSAGIMAVPEATSDDMAAQDESQYIRTTYRVGVTTGDDTALVDSLNMLSLQNSGILNSTAAESGEDLRGADNSMTIDIPAVNYDSFIQGLSSRYALDYVNVEAQDLSDEIYSLQLHEMYLKTSISELLSLQQRTIEEDNELETLQQELSDTTARLNELYALSSNVQINIFINNKD